AWTQENSTDVLARQKAAAWEIWKAMEFPDSPNPVETTHFLVYGRVAEAKSKATAQLLESAFATASKPLKFTDKDGPWPGKLVVFLVPARNDFVRLMRKAARRAPDNDEFSHAEISGDLALVIVGPSRSGGTELEQVAREEMLGLMLERKLGAPPPSWLRQGFVRSTVSRINRPSAKAAASATVSFGDLWNERLPDLARHQAATFYIDYWAYGPGSEWFDKLLSALRPGENGRMPPAAEVARSLNLDERSLDLLPRAWKKPASAASSPPKGKKP
ncbi:MAG: hypothetical protein N2039_15275, partial [Gemmataceae bacterium]|nr:hypothetical protein [Gemmataceae bacterium]